MNRNVRTAFAISIVLTVYTAYLFWAWFAFRQSSIGQYYIFPFYAVHQLGYFSFWMNLVTFITLALWTVWCVLFIRE